MPPKSAAPRPRLVATDLDGTLLRGDGSVSERTAAVLAALEAAGVPVVFVTGRPMRWMAVVRQHVGAHGLAVCSNGAVVTDLRTGDAVMQRAVPEEEALAVIDALRRALPGVRFATEGPDGFGMEPDYPVRAPLPAGAPVASAERLVRGRPLLKLMARVDGHDPDRLRAEVVRAVGGRVEATTSMRAPMVEMSAAGVTKATTLALVCARLGVTAQQVVAFGDMPNDLPMLRWAGRSFAVGDAHPEVLAAVTDRAAGADEDGVAVVLEEVFGVRPPAGGG